MAGVSWPSVAAPLQKAMAGARLGHDGVIPSPVDNDAWRGVTFIVIPAKAGTQANGNCSTRLGSRFRGNDKLSEAITVNMGRRHWDSV